MSHARRLSLLLPLLGERSPPCRCILLIAFAAPLLLLLWLLLLLLLLFILRAFLLILLFPPPGEGAVGSAAGETLEIFCTHCMIARCAGQPPSRHGSSQAAHCYTTYLPYQRCCTACPRRTCTASSPPPPACAWPPPAAPASAASHPPGTTPPAGTQHIQCSMRGVMPKTSLIWQQQGGMGQHSSRLLLPPLPHPPGPCAAPLPAPAAAR